MTQSTRLPENLRFFASIPHECGYLPNHTAVSVFADPDSPMNMDSYSVLVELGFRRSGGQVYRPYCPNCKACMPARIPVEAFQPNRTQRRTQRLLDRFSIQSTAAEFRDEQFALYRRYIGTRHAGGGMDNPDPERYLDFLTSRWSQTEFIEFRLQGRLVGVAVIDILTRGLSSVYTFFDPDDSRLSPGRLAILWQIQEARRRQLPWVFLGYWIKDCQKMAYKQEYRPIELFMDNAWIQWDIDQNLTG